MSGLAAIWAFVAVVNALIFLRGVVLGEFEGGSLSATLAGIAAAMYASGAWTAP